MSKFFKIRVEKRGKTRHRMDVKAFFCSHVSISLVIRPQYASLCSSFLRLVDSIGFPTC